jgi:cell division septation protein DedD
VTLDVRRARPLAGLLALVVGLAFAVPPAFAAEPTPDPSPTPRPTLAEAAVAAVDALPAATVAQAAQATPAPSPAPEGKSFFKTGKGAAVLVLLAAGLGYTAYSFSHDRVKSPAK